MKTSNVSKFLAELIGTMVLVLMGSASVVICGADGTTGVGMLGIGFAFGLSVVAMAYAIGHISGCHINPAISLAMVAAGRMKLGEALYYMVAQVIGAIIGAGLLYIIASGKEGYDIAVNGLAQNGYGDLSPQHYSMQAGLLAEVIFTFIFLLVIFGSTSTKNIHGGFAGLSIGLTLVLIHLAGIPITGVSVNPARSIGSAVYVGGEALSQVWLFIVAPIAGALLAAVVWKFALERD